MTPSQALNEIRALVASDGYAITAMTLGGFRRDLLHTIDQYLHTIQHDMTDLTQRLRALTDSPLASEAAQHIEQLNGTIAAQQTIMDKAASVIAEGLHADAGINKSAAQECIDAIRDHLKLIGKTTAEAMVEIVFLRLGAAAGLPPGTEFNPLAIIDQMRMTIAAQVNNAKYLQRALGSLWTPGAGDTPAELIVSAPGAPLEARSFPPETTWMEAMNQILSEDKPAPASPTH